MEVELHCGTWDNKPLILELATMPPCTVSPAVSTKTKAGLVTENELLPIGVTHDMSVVVLFTQFYRQWLV